MKIISHRGNLFGSNPETENLPIKISQCLSLGFDVEIDVWFLNKSFWLGHDQPTYKIGIKFLKQKGLWIHSKNIQALEKLHKDFNTFFISTDAVSLTSKNMLWVCTGSTITKESIAVLPEQTNYSNKDLKQCYAICTDYPYLYKEKFPCE